MDILFLGTGAGIPAKLRNVSAIALKLLEERKAIWLFDCGEGTQQQILQTSIKPRKIEKIFITHMHGDHIYGLPGLLSSRSFQGGESTVNIYGPKGIKDYVEISLKSSGTFLRYPLIITEIEEGVIFNDEQFTVEAHMLDHGLPSYGYRITEKDRPGTLLADKLIAAGIKPGPIYKKIKNGEDVITEDGVTINANQFIGPEKKGRIVTILGDTRECSSRYTLAKEADFLVHEATFAKADHDLAHEYFHSTTAQAAELAKKAAVRRLCLTHISSRYDRKEWKILLNEAKEIFPNTVMAEDFKEFSIMACLEK
ncbi:ribonuclease Z [Bacillaceae bacterium Marseille-Q3522]|nr:ribonuclease Z [Bacillaceae bacterium Marseille-Q3522]